MSTGSKCIEFPRNSLCGGFLACLVGYIYTYTRIYIIYIEISIANDEAIIKLITIKCLRYPTFRIAWYNIVRWRVVPYSVQPPSSDGILCIIYNRNRHMAFNKLKTQNRIDNQNISTVFLCFGMIYTYSILY